MSNIVKMQGNAAQNGTSQSTSGLLGSVAEEEGFLPLENLCFGPEGDVQHIKSKEEIAVDQAEKIIKKAEESAVQIEKDAYQKGYAQGESEGRAEWENKFATAIQNVDGLCKSLQEQLVEVHKQYEKDLLVLIKAMVDRLVNHEVSVNPKVIQACLLKTMEFVVENSVVRVHLHSDDFNRLKEAGLENPALFEGKSKVQLVEDPNVSMGGCLVNTDFGEVDSTLKNCRDKLYEAVDRAFMAALADDTSDEENISEA